MKKLLLIILYLYSCTQAKLITVSSDDLQKKNSAYVFENDSVRITYNFWADNGVIKFDIYNKIGVPIYFDWKNSAFIPNDQMVSYWHDETNTMGSSTITTSWLYSNASGYSKSIRQERIGVIPPHSLITKRDFRLVQAYYDVPKAGPLNKTNTFLNFRNYLMFSTNEKFEGKSVTVDNQFYVSDVKMIKYKNKDRYKAQNKFVVKSRTY